MALLSFFPDRCAPWPRCPRRLPVASSDGQPGRRWTPPPSGTSRRWQKRPPLTHDIWAPGAPWRVGRRRRSPSLNPSEWMPRLRTVLFLEVGPSPDHSSGDIVSRYMKGMPGRAEPTPVAAMEGSSPATAKEESGRASDGSGKRRKLPMSESRGVRLDGRLFLAVVVSGREARVEGGGGQDR